MLSDGHSLEAIIAELAREKADLQKRLTLLESICPKRYRLADGTILTWHCADEDVPEEQR